jgi:2-dehydropantoate 2-reductase
MVVLVYGAGAVGLGMASFLAQAGVQVHLLARASTAAAIRERGLVRAGIFGEHRVPPAGLVVHTSLATVPEPGPDFVLVATKSFDTEDAGRLLSAHPSARGQTRYVLFQNGWGNVEAFSAFLPPARVFAARVITGFTRPEPNAVRVTVHAEDIHLGSFHAGREAELDSLAAAIARGGMPCSTTPAIVRDLWAKMLYNCALNPLGAVFEATYGELGAREESRQIMDAVIAEIFTVMRAGGYETHWSAPEQYHSLFYGTLVPRTAAHESSMLQDIRAGKRTEIEALSGAVVRLAERGGAASPVNRLLLEMVRFKEQRNRERSEAPRP